MIGTAKRWAAPFALVTGLLILISCSSEPPGPQMGTPAFYWQAAHVVYAAGDYTKTLEDLDQLLATNNEYLDRALPWDLVLKSGLAAGYVDLAENYAVGERMNRSDPTAFHRVVSESRDTAARFSLQFAEGFAKFDNVKGDDGIGVTGQKILARADADDERRPAPRADNGIGAGENFLAS